MSMISSATTPSPRLGHFADTVSSHTSGMSLFCAYGHYLSLALRPIN